MQQLYFIFAVGGIFALLFILQLWLINLLHKRQNKEMEERMTKNMIHAIEKLEWGETNGRTKEES